MRVLAIDPGNEVSGWVLLDADASTVLSFGNATPNGEMLATLESFKRRSGTVLVVETFQPRGQPLYWQLVWTAIWIGQFVQAWGGEWDFLHRETVKLHVCGRTSVGDANVNAAIKDRWGGPKKAVGLKARQGPLYGLHKHAWPALAVAVAYAEGARSAKPDDKPVRPRKRDEAKKPRSDAQPEPRGDSTGRPLRRVRKRRPEEGR